VGFLEILFDVWGGVGLFWFSFKNLKSNFLVMAGRFFAKPTVIVILAAIPSSYLLYKQISSSQTFRSYKMGKQTKQTKQ